MSISAATPGWFRLTRCQSRWLVAGPIVSLTQGWRFSPRWTHLRTCSWQGSSVVVTEGQATLSVDQYSMLEASGNIADTKDFAVVDSVWRINDGGIDFSAPASVTAVVDPVDTDLTYFGSLATNATDLDLSQATNVRVTVEQVNGLNITNGSYDVVDSAGPIEDNIAEIDGAQNVYSNDVLTLTVAEYNALDDEAPRSRRTIGSGTRPKRTSAEILWVSGNMVDAFGLSADVRDLTTRYGPPSDTTLGIRVNPRRWVTQ